LFCEIGDEVEFVKAATTTPWENEPAEEVAVGDRYKVVGLVGYGWNLQRVSGKGPVELRLISSKMKEYVKLRGDE
jgi:hypothetical protein